MRRLSNLAPLLALLLVPSLSCGGASTPLPCAPTGVVDAETDPAAGLDEHIPQVMEAFEVPGLSIAVVHHDEVVYSRGFGVRRVGEEGAVDQDTVFAIASNTKPFVATVVGMLVAEEELGWDDVVVDHLPDFRLHDELTTREMRVRDLLAHRSGHATFAGDLMWIGARFDTAEVLRRIRFVEPASSFRTRYGYSNIMFAAAGEVIRARTERSWAEEVHGRLLEPLGMTRTRSSVTALADMDNVATPYMPYEGELVAIPYLDMSAAGAAGGLTSTAADMARWLRMQLAEGRLDGRQVVPAEVLAQTRVPHTPIPLSPAHAELYPSRHFLAYGLGWFLYDHHGRLVVTHGGGLPGMTSLVSFLPEEELGVVVLTNAESGAARALVMHIVDGALGVTDRDWLTTILELQREMEAAMASAEAAPEGEGAPPSLGLAHYAGHYDNPVLGRAEVREADGALELHLPDHGGLDGPLAHLAGDTFRCTWSNRVFLASDVPFTVQDGAVQSFRFTVRPEFVDPLEYEFHRIATDGSSGTR